MVALPKSVRGQSDEFSWITPDLDCPGPGCPSGQLVLLDREVPVSFTGTTLSIPSTVSLDVGSPQLEREFAVYISVASDSFWKLVESEFLDRVIRHDYFADICLAEAALSDANHYFSVELTRIQPPVMALRGNTISLGYTFDFSARPCDTESESTLNQFATPEFTLIVEGEIVVDVDWDGTLGAPRLFLGPVLNSSYFMNGVSMSALEASKQLGPSLIDYFEKLIPNIIEDTFSEGARTLYSAQPFEIVTQEGFSLRSVSFTRDEALGVDMMEFSFDGPGDQFTLDVLRTRFRAWGF